MRICAKDECTGCGMCVNLCSKNAIAMIPDGHGFLYPQIDEEKCVHCGLCTKKCPALQSTTQGREEPTAYAAWNADKERRSAASSGGIFSLLAKEILRRGGAVCGVRWDAEFRACHCVITEEKDMHMLYGSKYVQSITGNVYKQVKAVLENGQYVLFSGTPCQVSALRSFLGKEYERLYTVDVVCHGVPPYALFRKHLYELSGGDIGKIENVRLRFKDPCWSFSSVRVDFKNEQPYVKPTVEDAYFNLFNFNYSLRESCHKCKYTSVYRPGDITLCDFWGYSPQSFKTVDFDKGVSAVLLNTEKGDALFCNIKEHIVFEESCVNTVKQGNRCLEKPFPAPGDVADFWDDFQNGMSVEQLNKKYIKKPYTVPKYLWLRRIRRQFKWIIGR